GLDLTELTALGGPDQVGRQAFSRAPSKQCPCTSAMVGTGSSSKALMNPKTAPASPIALASSIPSKIDGSAPKEKSSPSARNNTARTSLLATSVRATLKSVSASAVIWFCGGLLITISPS